MRRLSHPRTRAVYEWAEDGVGPIRVTDRNGAEGRFDREGAWVAGEVTWADPELCRWVFSGGPIPGGAGGRSRRFSPITPPEEVETK